MLNSKEIRQQINKGLSIHTMTLNDLELPQLKVKRFPHEISRIRQERPKRGQRGNHYSLTIDTVNFTADNFILSWIEAIKFAH